MASGARASGARPVYLSGGRGRRIFRAGGCDAGRQREGALRARDPAASNKGEGSRFRRLLLAMSISIAVLLVGLKWSWIDAQARAMVVLSSVLETPRLTPAVE